LKLLPSSKTASLVWVHVCGTAVKGYRGSSRLVNSLRKSPVLVSERLGLLLLANASLLTLTLAETRKLPSHQVRLLLSLKTQIRCARFRQTDKRKINVRVYRSSPKGREAESRYDLSPKGREKDIRYYRSPRGLEASRRYEHGPARIKSRAAHKAAQRRNVPDQ
jgi:hypothetical protein